MTRTGGTETLRYGLYRDVLRLLPWDSGPNALGGLYLLNQFGAWQRTYVYGRIPAGQSVPAGSYADSPGVTITY